MDYPKSVPGVGLVGGKFVDENTAMGQQGSLIPSAWGNSVTEELLSLIRAAGVEPDEGIHDQIAKILWADPTDAARGMPLVATAAEVVAFVSTVKMLTPFGLKNAFFNNSNLAVNGYQKLPSGLIIQWGFVAGASLGTNQNFPISFPVSCVSITATDVAVANATAAIVVSNSQYKILNSGSNTSRWIAVGY